MQVVWYIVWIVASYYISQALAPKPDKPKPTAFSEWDFPQFKDGTPMAVVFGDVWTPDWFVLWFGNYRVSPIRTKSGK